MNNAANINEIIQEVLDKKGALRVSELSTADIEKGKEYISKIDLSKIYFDGGKAIKFGEINNEIELVRYLTSRSKINDLSEEYVSHYTSSDIARKIISGRKMQLGNPVNMNDGLEFSSPNMDCSKIYFASFSIENSENIAMWSMYGQPWEDGVKISIPKKTFMKWVDKIKRVYHVDPNTYENIIESPIEENKFKPSISRVAYVEWDVNGDVSVIKCGEQAQNKLLKMIDKNVLTGLIKDAAWSYEKEIRLRVDLSEVTDDKKVAIDIPDEIIRSMIITTGPRFNGVISAKDYSEVADINESIFAGKLNYVYCDRCKDVVRGKI